MIDKAVVTLSLFAAISTCFSQEISATKTGSQNLLLKKGDQALNCSSDFSFESFRYSGDHQFLLFSYFDEKLKIPLFLGFARLADAYKQCGTKNKIKITREPANANILDISEAGKIYLTYQEDMYSIGGSALHARTSVAVKRLTDSKEIFFPFSIKSRDSERLTMKKISLIGGPTLIDINKVPREVRVISRDGKYISPLGVSCEVENFYSSLWKVETRKKLSAEEIEALMRKKIRCEDFFG